MSTTAPPPADVVPLSARREEQAEVESLRKTISAYRTLLACLEDRLAELEAARRERRRARR